MSSESGSSRKVWSSPPVHRRSSMRTCARRKRAGARWSGKTTSRPIDHERPLETNMTYNLIDLTIRSGIATLTLNRPDKRNAMSDDMRAELIGALESIAADKAIRALVLTGAGKGFCAGGDVAGMERRMQAPAGEIAFNGWHRQQRVHHAQALLHTCPKPTIAAVNGAASGLGADTALACDFIIASEWATFTWSYIHRGIVPDGGGMSFLPRRAGLPKAKELIFSGRKVAAEEALTLGIADR